MALFHISFYQSPNSYEPNLKQEAKLSEFIVIIFILSSVDITLEDLDSVLQPHDG